MKNLKLITDERAIEDNPESHSDDQEKSKVIEESDSTIPDPSHQTVTSTPPVIAPFTDVSSTKRSSLVTPTPINTEATTITTSLPDHPIHRPSAKSGKIGSVKNQESEKSPKEIIRIKREQGKEKQESPYSIRSTNKVALEEFDLKSVVNVKEPQEKKHDSDDDEDDDDDEGPSAGSNQGKSAKRRRHDSGAFGSAQPPIKDDEQSSKKPRESDASASKQHPALTSTGWQITDTRDAVVDSSMYSSDPESEHFEQSSNDIPMQDEGHVSDLEDTDNAHIPKVSTTTWFKPIPKENNWANTYATTYQVPAENKLQRKSYDIGSFIKWFCRRTGKKKLCKADLEGPAFNLVKAFHKNNVFLQFQMDECHKLLTNKVDLVNPEGHQILRNIYEPLPLGGPPGQCGLMAFPPHGGLGGGILSQHNPSESSDREAVRSQMRILSVISVKVFEKYGYNYLSSDTSFDEADYKKTRSRKRISKIIIHLFGKSFLLNIQEKLNHLPKTDKTSLHTAVNMWIRNLVIRNRVGDLQLGIESYQTKINLERPNWDAADYYFKEDYTIVPKPRVIVYRDINDQRKLMRLNELHKFSDGTLTRVMEKLDHMVAVSSSLRLLEPKRTIESRAKRSSINLVRTQHPSETMVFHNEDGNPARANIKQALGIFLKMECYERPHKGVKASANSSSVFSSQRAQMAIDYMMIQEDPGTRFEPGNHKENPEEIVDDDVCDDDN
ncbi:hypothetical protein Tco_0902404 [Tanacetum coccineum]